MLHKLLGLEAILLVRQVQWVEPLVQGVVESIMQRPYQGENFNCLILPSVGHIQNPTETNKTHNICTQSSDLLNVFYFI